MSLSGINAYAQTQIKGIVYDTDKSKPLTGASVVVEGKNIADVTDLDGKFTVKARVGDILKVQFMGYSDQEVRVGKAVFYEIILKPNSEQLSEVIVTALGMKREKRSLGYAATDVSGDQLNSVQNSNWLSGMEGKVAGIQFNKSSGPLGSTKVVVRGESSLDGNSSALFVVDGVPINSGSVSNASGSGYSNQDNPIDFGDGASDINPDDIASVTVLKGAAATALYGSRAGDGAIIITTKSGLAGKGIGVTYSTQFTADVAGYWPDFQTEYGPGTDLGLDEYNFWTPDYNSEGLSRHYSRYAFGEKYDASKMRFQYDGMNWDTMMAERTPWIYQDDWYTGIFRNGWTWDNSLSLQGGNGKGTSVRLSFKTTKNEWILPNTGYDRKSIAMSFKTKVNKYINLTTNVNYYMTDSDNMPSSGYSNNSVVYQLAWGETNTPMQAYKDEYFLGRWNADTFSNNTDLLVGKNNYYNPYRVLYEMTNTEDKDRIFGSVGLNINLWKNKLTLDIKSGMDMTNEFRTQRKPFYTYNYPQGWYREQSNFLVEFNTDFMLKYTDSFLADRLTLTAGFGGNDMTYNRRSWKYTIDKLSVENVYEPLNYPSGTLPDYSSYRSQKVVNSLYGLVSLGWDDWAYLDLTARNDWSSTLSPGNWSYFYPSVSASILVDKVAHFQDYIPEVSFLKLRLSWANVGKDTSPYSISYGYTSTDFAGGYRPGATYPDYYLKPENVETWEAGMEAKFLKNRIGLDVALYRSDITNQIYDVPYDYITGAKYYTKNIGLIRNKGIEISANFIPVKTRDWKWSINVNASKNIGVLKRMYDGWDNANPHQEDYGTTIGSRLFVYDYVGKTMGQLWGKGLAKAPAGSYYMDASGNKVDCSGQVILSSSTGLPSFSDELQYYGNVNPKWLGGISTSVKWKNLTVGATFSAQLGGKTYSVTAAVLGYQGKLTNTLEGRNDGLVASGVNVIGTDSEGNSICQVNSTITTDVEKYYATLAANRYNFEEYIYDNSFLKMKELTISYDIPSKLIKKTKVLQGISISAYATNLFCITDYPFYDPEVSGMNGSNLKRGIESGSFPMNRSYGANIKLKF
jgi:TonB-linked SusC/RagA family outer membrane protein